MLWASNARRPYGLLGNWHTPTAQKANTAQEETLYREDVKANPDSRYRLNRLARLLVSVPGRSRRRPEEALQLARRALKGTPDVATYYNTLGLAEYRNGLWDGAVVSLNKSAEMNKGSVRRDKPAGSENANFSRERISDPLGPEFCAVRREVRSEA